MASIDGLKIPRNCRVYSQYSILNTLEDISQIMLIVYQSMAESRIFAKVKLYVMEVSYIFNRQFT